MSLKTNWFPLLLGLIIIVAIIVHLIPAPPEHYNTAHSFFNEDAVWSAPPDDEIPEDSNGDKIRFGRELIMHTSYYLGPKGISRRLTNGMNCQNCHLQAGTQPFANPFSSVFSTYPIYRPRSGRIESLAFRINDCMQRSLNGSVLDSNSAEMNAMKAYILWAGKNVPKGFRPKGSGVEDLPYMNRAADTLKGKAVYLQNCTRCHGQEGEGIRSKDQDVFMYPPLWGSESYNTAAGMYRLSRLAGFIKNNMPSDKADYRSPVLSTEEAWDVAAYISSRERPVKIFSEDWPDIKSKPVDFPFGPYQDHNSELQHKYGPWKKK